MNNICYVPLQGGESVSFTVPDPAAGANWLYTIPAGYEYEIRALQCKLTTAAAGGVRYPLFVIYDTAANDHWRLYFTRTIPNTGETAVFSLYRLCRRADFSIVPVAGNSSYNDAIPACRLPQLFQIGAAFSGLNVADQWSEIRIIAHRWRT